ncbi:glycoside hydrolase superfamily [Sporodiniella umbellata]|nr:glycoside hydrolase superfamily [Sporodiniella umbellata]
MMTEGFQCWSTTKEMSKHNKLPAIPTPVSWITKFNLQGDYDFFNYSGQSGHLHATGYTYLRHVPSGQLTFIGSVSEHNGYSYFKADMNRNRWTFYKDVEGKRLKKGETLSLKYVVLEGADLGQIWSRYATYYDPQGEFRQPRHLTGWSSWYNFYERVTEADVRASLDAFEKHPYPVDVIQIDDGYQTQIGDWLNVNHKFPKGMQALAEAIQGAGKMPGLWLAPFAVGFKSKIVKEHPDWLLKYPGTEKFLVAGPNWGGFYALDIYHPDVRVYLQSVFDCVIDTWGYKLLKLDFLFAAAMVPRLGKSRGEIMWDATDLVVEWVRKRALILGSGVTLPSVWGKFEYNRVSSDASPWWDHTVLKLAHVRERVSTSNAIISTLHRWPMGSRIFGSDPDVFFIRSNNNQLSPTEKHTLLAVNLILGQLTLMSDNVALYSDLEHALYESTFPKPEATVTGLTNLGLETYRIDYTCNQRQYVFFTNLSPLPYTAHLPFESNGKPTYYFEHSNVLTHDKVDWLKSQAPVFLSPHETRMFMKITDHFMGSTAHLVPGTELASLSVADEVHITLKKRYQAHTHKLYIRLDSDKELPKTYVNQKSVHVKKYVWNQDISVIKVTF